MKKITLVVAVLMMFAAPAVATVDVECTCDGNEVTVSYVDGADPNRVRAFALDVTVDNDANIVSVSGYKIGESVSGGKGYGIFPGSIDILDEGADIGEVNDWGSPVCDPCYPGTLLGLDSNGVTIEMGSLYVGEANAPDTSDVLFTFIVDNDCDVTITENTVRGGVVLEDPCAAVDFNSPGCTVQPECYAGRPDYDYWADPNCGKPECWCYPRQCHGDADGRKQGNDLFGWKYVGTDDLAIMSLGWLVLDPPHGPGIANLTVNGVPVACADFAHDRQGNDLFGWKRIGTNDLGPISQYWLVLEPELGPGTPGDCLPGNREPPPEP